ncbi:MAG TPA: hypothetical protein PK781_09140 [Terrimesophilobacter sp.]|nr:hypothetical protein [Terrimesophilobacter sp.]HRQ00611.1 hypothetical protein [Terrimesophilobacter sp.]
MTEPQVWVLMGIFATAIFGMLGWQTASFNRNLMIMRDSLRETMEIRFAMQDARFDALEKKIENLDREVQAIAKHVFGSDPRP